MNEQTPVMLSLLPEIKGITFSRKGFTFLRRDALLDYSDINEHRLKSIIPVAVLYAVIGIVKTAELRKIPVPVSGRIVYPVSSLLVPELHSRLIINEQSGKIRYQGNFFSSGDKPDPRGMKLIGITFELLFESGPAEHFQERTRGDTASASDERTAP